LLLNKYGRGAKLPAHKIKTIQKLTDSASLASPA
jgi:hypothetical protein